MTVCSTSPKFFRRACLVLVIVALQDVTLGEVPVKHRVAFWDLCRSWSLRSDLGDMRHSRRSAADRWRPDCLACRLNTSPFDSIEGRFECNREWLLKNSVIGLILCGLGECH